MRAAMMDPAVMLLDEPMAALDPLIRRSLQQELKSIFQRLGKTVLLVTHDLGEAVFLAEQITLLHEGRIVQTGSVSRFVAASRRSIRDGIHQCAAHLAGRGRGRMKGLGAVAERLPGVQPLLLAALGLQPAPLFAADRIVVGSKAFTEGYVLGEIAAQTIESATNVPVTRKLGMGSTGIVFEALNSGAIDVYSDYTGTLAEAILKQPDLKSVEDIRHALLKMGLVMSEPLGFDDTYALAVKESFAQEHELHSISDLSKARRADPGRIQLRIHGSPGWLSGDGGRLSVAFGAAEDQSHGTQPYFPGDR